MKRTIALNRAALTRGAPSLVATALAATALAATALVAPPAAAAPSALVKKSFGVMAEFTGQQIVESGRADGIGNLTIDIGKVDGGTVTTVSRVVAPGKKKDAELRDTQTQVQLKDGMILAQAVNEDPVGKLPKTLHILPVTGGTGAYASARGTLLVRPVGDKYLMAYDIFVDKDLRKASFAFGAPTTVRGTGTGSATVSRAVQDARSYISVSTSLGNARASIDLQVFDGESTLFARTVTQPKSGRAIAFALLGGTGQYAGARGELTLSADGRAVDVRYSTPAGKSKPLSWINKQTRSYDDSGVMGATDYSSGSITPVSGQKQPKGDYFASELTYPAIDGVTPIVTMIEQGFATGTMLITGIRITGGTLPLPVVGGTGDYGGAAGSVRSEAVKTGLTRESAAFWR